MINIHGAKLIDVVPPNWQQDPRVIAFCHAVDCGVERLLKKVDGSLTWSYIDSVPAERLDMLAAELRTPFYTPDLPVGTKREMIKKTLGWYSKLGTPGVIEDIVSVVFGQGQLTEWFDYDGQPYTFRIDTNASVSPAQFIEFAKFLQKIKNTRSQLERLGVNRSIEGNVYVGSAMRIVRTITVAAKERASRRVEGDMHVSGATRVVRTMTIRMEDRLDG